MQALHDKASLLGESQDAYEEGQVRNFIDCIVLAYRRWAWPKRQCQRCEHRLDDHWWEHPEFCCRAGWFDKQGQMMKTGGCPCGEFQGLAWLDVIEALRP